MDGRVRTDGKFFAVGGRRFVFRGLQHHAAGDCAAAMAQLREAGFSVVVTPSLDAAFLSTAGEYGLYVLADVRLPPWRDLGTADRRQARSVVRSAAGRLASAITAIPGDPHLLGAMISPALEPNGAPASPRLVRRVLDDLARYIRDLDADMLVAACLPSSAQECPIELDFLVTAPEPGRWLSTALAEAHLLVGDRPLLLYAAEPSLDSRFDASRYEEMVDTAAERGAAGTVLAGGAAAAPTGWLATPESRSAVARANRRSIAELDVAWPSVTVVVCAYNAAGTLDECLRHIALLDYPKLEVIVVDDGSRDETATIVNRHSRVDLVRLDHAGLSEARNVGFRHAKGEMVAYLDADAYPPPEWVRFLVLGSLDDGVVASGGPNVPSPDDPARANVIAYCPGTPIPALYRADRALHLPGCNMAFRREVLIELGGFHPALTAAADDVDLQLRIRERGLELGYHPAAFVWHHRRPGVRPYLKQQHSYGRAQTLLAARNPGYFHRHRWHKLRRALGRGTRPDWPVVVPVFYRSQRWRQRHGLDLAHQWGVPVALAALATAPLGWARRILVGPAALAGTYLVGLFGIDAALAFRDLQRRPRRLLMAVQIAVLQVLRPPAFVWGTFTQAARQRLARARGG
jgi:glycosyltransferase involved in cell wall biosynthesis